METPPVVHSTFVLERHYPVPPSRVFAAFADPAQRRSWFAESRGHEVDEFASDLRPDGESLLRYRLGPQTPFPGFEIVNRERFLDVAEDRRIIVAQAMDFGGRRISATLVTIELEPSEDGTRMTCTHQGAFLEGADGPEMRQGGWEALLDRLGALLA